MRSEHVSYVRPDLLLKPSLWPNLKKSQGSLAHPRAEHAQECAVASPQQSLLLGYLKHVDVSPFFSPALACLSGQKLVVS